MIYGPLTKLQCSPTSDGSGAAILASEAFVEKHGLADQAVEIVGQSMVTDMESTFDGQERDQPRRRGHDPQGRRARSTSRPASAADDVDVIELHDCFSANELLTYEALGLCAEGEGGKLVDNDDTTYGGRWVVNPSGGLISKGHPLGATGLAQCAELTWQLRGTADARQVERAASRWRRAAAQHRPRRRGRRHRLPPAPTEPSPTTRTALNSRSITMASVSVTQALPVAPRSAGTRCPTCAAGRTGSPSTRAGRASSPPRSPSAPRSPRSSP